MKQNIDIIFVILHYLTIKDTKECVNSIINNVHNCKFHIIIVDNASPNGTGNELKKEFADINLITVLLNNKNMGFACGNNVGFRYAKTYYDPQFIALINNDTVILQNEFYDRVSAEYNLSHFAALGPMIMTADGKCNCNPVFEKTLTREVIIKQLKREELRTKLLNLGLRNPKNFFVKGRKPSAKYKDFIYRKENVCLHGCFIIFGKSFINEFDGLNEETFLYHEEEILFVQLMAKGLKTVYLPELQIYHKEDSAAKAIGRKKLAAQKFAYNCSANSCRVLLKVYDECYPPIK